MVNVQNMLESFTQIGDVDSLKTMDFVGVARAYLRNGGMTEEEIDHLAGTICR